MSVANWYRLLSLTIVALMVGAAVLATHGFELSDELTEWVKASLTQ